MGKGNCGFIYMEIRREEDFEDDGTSFTRRRH